MEHHQQEKVYVAVGKDVQEGLSTLAWALRNWASSPTSFVILHVSNIYKHLAYTPFGKLPPSSVNNQKLEITRVVEQERTDKLLSKYMAFCCKAKAEIVKFENSEGSIHKAIVGLISKLRITKLVMGITFTKSLSWKAKTGTSASIYVHKHKPEFCNLFMVCRGKLVFLRDQEKEEGYFEDEQGLMLADMRKKSREKSSFKGWLLSKFSTDNSASSSGKGYFPHAESSSVPADERWEDHAEEMENYLQSLLASNLEDGGENGCGGSLHDPDERAELEIADRNMLQRTPKTTEELRAKIEAAQRIAVEKKNEAKAQSRRRTKAEWSISLCNKLAAGLMTHLKEEMDKQIHLQEELETVREQLREVAGGIAESEDRLRSVALDLEGGLKIELRASCSAKSHVEAQLEAAAIATAGTLCEMDETRRQRDGLRRRIEIFRERESAAASANRLNCRSFREFTAGDVTDATNDFSEHAMVRTGASGAVYRWLLNNTVVAVQFKVAYDCQSPEEFKAQVDLLAQIRHPHLVTMIGACEDRRCIVSEYMHNGSLADVLFSRPHLLPWRARVRIAEEVCSGLCFLHSTFPKPTAHGDLRLTKVLLDQNLVAKIADYRGVLLADRSRLAAAIESDVRGLGTLILQLLTRRETVHVADVQTALEGGGGGGDLAGVLDPAAGDWPLDLAVELAEVGLRCAAGEGNDEVGLTKRTVVMVLRELKELNGRAEWTTAEEGRVDVPGAFLCPILQEVMKQPHVAADGFSYELEAIQEWLGCGHETSPMTNLKLKHKFLTPNHTLRSLINGWHFKAH